MEARSESTLSHGTDSDDLDTTVEEQFEEASPLLDSKSTEAGEKSKGTPARTSEAAEDQQEPPPVRKQRKDCGSGGERAASGQLRVSPRSLRPRHNTVGPSSADTALHTAPSRITTKKSSIKKKSPAATASAIQSTSTESLEWDSSTDQFKRPDNSSRLWSTTTQFEVPISPTHSSMSDLDGNQQLDSAANSTASTVVNSTNQTTGSALVQPTGQSQQTEPPITGSLTVPSSRQTSTLELQSRPSIPSQWPSIALAAISKAQECIYPYQDTRIQVPSTSRLRA